MRRFLIPVALLVSCFMAPPQSHALHEDAISAVEIDALDRICSAGHREWLLCYNEDPALCRQIATKFIRPCLREELKDVNHKFSVVEAGDVAASLIQCFNVTFTEQHPAGKKNSPECEKQPEHLK